MREHELRRQVVAEMHLRRWPVLAVPSLITQWLLIVDEDEREAEYAFLDGLFGAQGGSHRPAHRSGEVAHGISCVWERHSEGSSMALFSPPTSPELEAAYKRVLDMPGAILRATQIHVVAKDTAAQKLLPSMQFEPGETISCHFAGKARLWADFRLKEDGFGHVVAAANGLDQRDFTRAVQRVQELGNYRNKALLGLPVAQEAWPRLDAAEQQLATLSTRVAGAEERDDELMEELSRLSLELTAIATAIGYRMSATRAYAALVRERLEQLHVTPLEGYASLANFTQRRFQPAVRTCAAVTAREEQLSERASRLASLLRARINTRIENQNARLLRSMERSSSLQLRLQQLVEGLSVVALSYYLIGLVGYVLKGMSHSWPGLDPELVMAVLVVPVVLGVWLALRVVKTRVLGES
ncbi:DUF3422 domain-containing protein [Alteraurantiacibacter aquimixticola]|uniref:DUF3422 family protein n=1 Tax=Alteraurantiacibacter aquimixticola TaxID=2489173 RepID=A0A4T3F6X3_9SPHN|nr:DUF3422 domain-containing protein [Alteraurantiacibacter aquimixticola]TIX51442.1 DUF3422 family protein [Alteraurantiacibacter aquimixticola]